MQELAGKIRKKLDEVSSLLSSRETLKSKITYLDTNDEKIMSWSKFNAFSVIPFYNELTGFKCGDMQYKEPKNKKNVYCYIYKDGAVNKILSYNSKGNIEDVSNISQEGNLKFEIKQNVKGEFISISQVIMNENKRPEEAYYVNDDDNLTGYYYFYEENVISKILTVSNNSPLPYVILSCSYDEEGEIKEIYFENKGRKVNVFSA